MVVAHQCGVFAGEGLGRHVGAVAVAADCDSDIFHVYRPVREESGCHVRVWVPCSWTGP